MVKLAQKYPEKVVVSAGVHPFWSAAIVNGAPREDGADCTPAAVAKMAALAALPEVRVIGEGGLDFFAFDKYPSAQIQRCWFQTQVCRRYCSCCTASAKAHAAIGDHRS